MRTVVMSTNGNEAYEALIPLATRAWKHYGWDVTVMRVPADIEDSVYLAAIIRLFGYANDGYSMLSDADIIPLQAGVFNDMMDWPGPTSYGFDLTRHCRPPQVPMCYVGASAKAWGVLMGGFEGDTPLDKSRFLLAEYRRRWPGADPWFADQTILAERLAGAPTRYIERGITPDGWAVGRYDRGTWPNSTGGEAIDIHAPHDITRIFDVVAIMERHGL